jgi:predicted anti-sigma-YlaC factor YlaD
MDMNKVEMKTKLSTLWIFVMLNMIFADILSFMDSKFLQELMTGYAGDVQITPSFLLLAAVCLEIPIAMVLLSRLLKYRINRWANIMAGIFTILFVIGGGSTAPHYIFFATIEVVCLF